MTTTRFALAALAAAAVLGGPTTAAVACPGALWMQYQQKALARQAAAHHKQTVKDTRPQAVRYLGRH